MPSWSEKATESAIDYARERLGIEGLKKQSESFHSLRLYLAHYRDRIVLIYNRFCRFSRFSTSLVKLLKGTNNDV